MRSEVLKLAANGVARAEILRLTGCPRSTVYRWIRQGSRHHVPKTGRPGSIELNFKTNTLRRLLAQNFSDPHGGNQLWTWKTVQTIIPIPALSRQTVIRFLQRCGIHPGANVSRFDRFGIPDGGKSEKSFRTLFYLLESCSWEKPDWMPANEVPQRPIVLWRLRGRREELFFGFSDDDVQSAHVEILSALRTTMCDGPDAIDKRPFDSASQSSSWIVMIKKQHDTPRRR